MIRKVGDMTTTTLPGRMAAHLADRRDCGGPDQCDWCGGYWDIRHYTRAYVDTLLASLGRDGDDQAAAAEYGAGVNASVADMADGGGYVRHPEASPVTDLMAWQWPDGPGQ
jgi:hypothetical protein